jgi:hypothetical protein
MPTIDLSSITASTWIAIVSACAALSSAAFAFNNFRTARKALALSVNTSKLANANVGIYLVDSFRYRIRKSKITLYVFCISIESKSTLPNSVIDAELRIPFVKDGLERVAVFRHTRNLAAAAPLLIQNVMQTPTPLLARGGLIGNFCFEIPQGVLDGSEFGPLGLRVKYAEGLSSDIEQNIIMDVIDAEDLEKKRRTGVPI